MDEDILAAMTPVDKRIVVTYAECGMTVNKTGRILYCSGNNVAYHLTKVRTTTGLDPRDFYQLGTLVALINKERSEFDEHL